MRGALPGPVQTVGRAELQAALTALEAGAAMVVSDNQGVVNGANNIALGITRRIKPTRVNADLWVRVLRAAGRAGKEVARWVPSHRGEEAVKKGEITAKRPAA